MGVVGPQMGLVADGIVEIYSRAIVFSAWSLLGLVV